MNSDNTSPSKYISRMEFLRDACAGKSVLSLGCSSGRFVKDHLSTNTHLHTLLDEVSSELYGIDIDKESLDYMREELGYGNLYFGDVEKLDQVPINRTFDVVLAGDILEHITSPGAMLDGVNRFLGPDSQLIISTNNAFGLHYQIRRWLGYYREHFEHVAFYSPETLAHMVERHNLTVSEIYGAYTRPPTVWKQKLLFFFGLPLFRFAPVLAGTLIVVATRSQPTSTAQAA